MFPSCFGTKGHIREGITYVVMLSYLFPREYSSCIRASSTSIWPPYVLGDSTALCRSKQGSGATKARLEMQTATLQIHLSQIESVRTAWMEGRAEQGGEKWLADCVSWPVRSGHIIPWPYWFSLAPWCAVKPCLPACHATAKPWVGLRWHLGPAWHRDDAEIGQVEREGTRDGGIAPKGHRFEKHKVLTWSSLLCR